MQIIESFLKSPGGPAISIRHLDEGRPEAVIIAPGFFQSKETPTFRKIQGELQYHFDTIGMDFRGHGRSGGWYTFSAREAEDLRLVAEYARTRYSRVGVLGFSYGGAVAILEAAEHRNIDSLICVGSPMASRQIELRWWRREALLDAWRGLEAGSGVRAKNPFLPKKDPIDCVASVGAPLLLIHGAKDATVSVRHSRELFARASEPKELRIFEDATHAQEIWRRHPAEFLGAVRDWFLRTLRVLPVV